MHTLEMPTNVAVASMELAVESVTSKKKRTFNDKIKFVDVWRAYFSQRCMTFQLERKFMQIYS